MIRAVEHHSSRNRQLKFVLASLAFGVLAVLLFGSALTQRAAAQVSGGVYEGKITEAGGSEVVGTIRLTVSANGAAVNAVEFVGFGDACILEVTGGAPISRSMDLYAPPVLTEGVAFNAYEIQDNDYTPPRLDISVQGTFVSEDEARGTVQVSGSIPYEPPPLSPPANPTPPPCPQLQGFYFNENFSFTVSLVSPSPPTTPGVRLPDTGTGGATASGDDAAILWPLLGAALVASVLAGGSLLLSRRR